MPEVQSIAFRLPVEVPFLSTGITTLILKTVVAIYCGFQVKKSTF